MVASSVSFGPEQLVSVVLDRSRPAVVVVQVIGEVDSYSTPVLRDALVEPVRQRCSVVVDVSRVTFLGLAGLRVLEEARDAAGPERAVVLAGTSGALTRVIDVPALGATMEWYPTVPLAVAACC